MFMEPRELPNKSALTHFAAAREMTQFPFEMGSRFLNITHPVFDRAVYSAEDKLMRQQHELSLTAVISGMEVGQARILKLLSCYVSRRCSNHDVQNALKWSIHSYIEDKDPMKNMWKVIASLRNGF